MREEKSATPSAHGNNEAHRSPKRRIAEELANKLALFDEKIALLDKQIASLDEQTASLNEKIVLSSKENEKITLLSKQIASLDKPIVLSFKKEDKKTALEDELIALLDEQTASLDEVTALSDLQITLLDEEIVSLDEKFALLVEKDALLDKQIASLDDKIVLSSKEDEKIALLEEKDKKIALLNLQIALLNEKMTLVDIQISVSETQTTLLDEQHALLGCMMRMSTNANEITALDKDQTTLHTQKMELYDERTALWNLQIALLEEKDKKIALLWELKTKFEILPQDLKAELSAKHRLFSHFKTDIPVVEATPTATHGLFSNLMNQPEPRFEEICEMAISGAAIITAGLCWWYLNKDANGDYDTPNTVYPGSGWG